HPLAQRRGPDRIPAAPRVPGGLRSQPRDPRAGAGGGSGDARPGSRGGGGGRRRGHDGRLDVDGSGGGGREARARLRAVPRGRGPHGEGRLARDLPALPAGAPGGRGRAVRHRRPALAGVRRGGEPPPRPEGRAPGADGMSETAGETTLRRTPLHDEHLALGARMVPFAGYEMPVQYPDGITAEHRAVRAAAGLFDVSHMGELVVRGPDALALVQRVTVNDAARIETGQAQYTAMCLDTG